MQIVKLRLAGNGVNRHIYSVIVGLAIGITAGIVGLGLALAGPVITLGLAIGILAGLYILSNVSAALYGVIFITTLLPFGTLPFKIAITPTLLDMALGAFLLVYMTQWMTGQRHRLRLTPVHLLVGLYALWLVLAFALGLRYGAPTSAILRQFAETIMSIALVFILVDLLREPEALRRLVLVVMIAVGIQALTAIVLYILPDATSEQLLVRLARIGYPDGGVIRYIEDNPANAERAIGTWVDPNALGGILAISATIFAPQVFARKPIVRYRWLALAVLGVVAIALMLTFSRASMLAFAIGICLIGLVPGNRRYLILVAVGGLLLLALPQTRTYIERFAQAFSGTDLATQMRLGEYGDSFELISRYPIAGVGFTGTPDIDVYSNAASLYLIMANQIGLVGLGLFLAMIAGTFVYGWRAYRRLDKDSDLKPIHLGYHAALVAALMNATADLYFFRLDFQSSITSFWLLVGLAIAVSRLVLEAHKSTVAKQQ